MHNDVRYPIFRYTLTLEDYRHFRFYHNRKLAMLWLILYFFMFVGTAFIAGAEGRQSHAVASMGVLVCAVIGAIMWLAHRWQTWHTFRTNPFIRQEHVIECGPNGFRILTSSTDLTIRWKEMISIVELPGQFVFMVSRSLGFVVPKSYVEHEAFGAMIEHHMPPDRIKFRK